MLDELPTLTVTLPADEERGEHAGTLIPVTLRAVLTDIGTLQLWCEDGSGRKWKLEFELRGNEAAS